MRRANVPLILLAAVIAACGTKEKTPAPTAAAPSDTGMPTAMEKAKQQMVRLMPIAAPTNLDFEGGAGADGYPSGWGGGGWGYAFSVASDSAHGGKGAFRLKWNRAAAPDSNDWATLTQCADAKAWQGKRLQLTGFMKSAGVDTGAGIWMRVDTTDHGMESAFDNMLDRPMKGTTDWKGYSVVLDVDRKAVDICYGVVMVGTGTVWADDLALKVVGKEVKVTGKPPTKD